MTACPVAGQRCHRDNAMPDRTYSTSHTSPARSWSMTARPGGRSVPLIPASFFGIALAWPAWPTTGALPTWPGRSRLRSARRFSERRSLPVRSLPDRSAGPDRVSSPPAKQCCGSNRKAHDRGRPARCRRLRDVRRIHQGLICLAGGPRPASPAMRKHRTLTTSIPCFGGCMNHCCSNTSRLSAVARHQWRSRCGGASRPFVAVLGRDAEGKNRQIVHL